MMAGKITHIVFDLDGLLLDTEILYTECTQAILSRYGLVFDWSIKAKTMGRAPLAAAQVLVDEVNLPMTAEEFHKELYGNLMEKFPDARLMPGAEALILHFKSLGLPTAIATGSAQVSYRKKVTNYSHLFDWMSHVVCSDDPEVKHGKPAPDIYKVAAARFKTPPQSCTNVLVFEDSPNGMESAKAAGMKCVMVPDKRTEPERCANADCVIKSLADLNLEEWGIPPIRN